MQGTPSSFGDAESTGGIPTPPNRPANEGPGKGGGSSGGRCRCWAVAEQKSYDGVFVAAALDGGGFEQKEAISTGAILLRRLKAARQRAGVAPSQIATTEDTGEFDAGGILHVAVWALWAAAHIKKGDRDRAISEDPAAKGQLQVTKASGAPGIPAGSAANEGSLEALRGGAGYMAGGCGRRPSGAGGVNPSRAGGNKPHTKQKEHPPYCWCIVVVQDFKHAACLVASAWYVCRVYY